MLDERKEGQVEIEILSLSPPRIRIRGLPGAAAEAAREILRASAIDVQTTIEVPEVHEPDGAPVPGQAAIQTWLETRGGEPYTLIDLASEITGESSQVVRDRFYVRAGRDQRLVGSDYRAICVARHRTATRDLENQGWKLIEKPQPRGPTQFRLLPPEVDDAT